MDDKLVEDVARLMYAAGLISPPQEAIDENWPYYVEEARAAIAVVRAAVVEECAGIVEELTMQSGMCDGVTVSKRIRSLKGSPHV